MFYQKWKYLSGFLWINSVLLLAFLGLFVSCFQFQAISKTAIQNSQKDYRLFAKIPILNEGRIKPMNTFARSYLTLFSGRDHLKGLSANAWLTEVLFDSETAYQRPVFKITDKAMLDTLQLNPEPSKRYAFKDLVPAIYRVIEIVQSLEQKKPDELSLQQQNLIQLYQKTILYYDISRSLSLILPAFKIENEELANQLNLQKDQFYTYLEILPSIPKLKSLMQEVKQDKLSNKIIEQDRYELIKLNEKIYIFENDYETSLFKIIPPQWQGDQQNWFSPWESIEKGKGSPKTAHYLNLWKKLANSYFLNQNSNWNKTLYEIKQTSDNLSAPYYNPSMSLLENWYNRLDVFYYNIFLYLSAIILLIAYFLTQKRRIYKFSVLLTSIGFLLQSMGLLSRIILLQRPPVSTLYESLLFVCWVLILILLIIEFKRRDQLALLSGNIAGLILQFIALGYGQQGDTMVMLRAVLETNFWLATHVLMIAIGYAFCLILGGFAHIELINKTFFYKQKRASLLPYIIGLLFWSLFFTALGTLLGGIWADQSWGRFWGWDPKENGALLIVLWLVFILHARLSNLLSEQKFLILSALTVFIVVCSWFGVNLLNIGLHTYGATRHILINLILFTFIETAFISLMLIYPKWRKNED